MVAGEQTSLSDEQPVCLRCSLPVNEWLYYCPDCGAPVSAYTTWLPFERIRAYGECLVRAARASLRGNRFSAPTRLLGLLLVLTQVPLLFLILPFGRWGKGRPPTLDAR